MNQEIKPTKPVKHLLLTKPFLFIYCVLSIFVVSFLLQSSFVGDWFLPLVGVFLLFFVFILAHRQEQKYRKPLYMLNYLIISSIVFWAMFWQMFFSVNLFIDRLINKNVWGFEIPTTAFYSLESIFVILFGPGLAWVWHTLNQRNRNPSSLIKFIVAIVFVGAGFLTLAVSTFFPDSANLVNPLWIVVSYLLVTIGEMLLSPIGLSAVTMLSPPHLTGMMMGIWFVALGFGGQFAGLLAKLASVPDSSVDLMSQLPIYRHAFLYYSYIAFGVAIGLFLLQRVLKKILD